MLGPILFLLYINDLPSVSSTCEFTLFADDATLTVADHFYDTMVNRANADLSLVHDWTRNNRLMLNADKTCVMLFTNRNNDVTHSLVSLFDVSSSYVHHMKFLGLHIDIKLNFSAHLRSLASRLAGISGMLYAINANTPEAILIGYGG